MKGDVTMCPLLGNSCIGCNCAWHVEDAEPTCAMYSIASSLSNLNAKSIDADEFLQVVERIAG